jgi:hypothetical protein
MGLNVNIRLLINNSNITAVPIPVAAWFKAWDCGRSLAGIADSNAAEGMDVCLLLVLCVVRQRSLCRVDHSPRGVLTSAVCLSVIVKPRY